MSEHEQGPPVPPEKGAGTRPAAGDVGDDETLVPVHARASPAAPGSVTPRVGDRLGPDGRFELLEKLGTGGMGVVFRAHDRQLDRAVAVKFVRPARLSWEQLVEQLTLEAKANAKLNHENIVALFDLDTWNGAPFLVMELLQGRSLRELLAQERLAAERALAIAIDVARGLAHAHRNGVVHRDLKPSNVFILPDGRAKVLDFGLARSTGAESGLVDGGLFDDETALTGTPAYMSPEQWRREPQDGRADVWAMGVLLHEMLVGAVPFSATELRRFLLPGPLPHLPVPSVRAHRAELPQEADRVLGRALTAAPTERYQSADEMLSALVALQAQLKAPQDGKSPARPRAEAERRLLTLLCCTLARAPASDEDEEDEALRAFHQLCADTIEHFEGTLATSVSGQVLACFGYPQVDEEDAVRAVRAALAIVEAGNGQSPPLEIQVGLHSGPVVVQTRQGVPALQGEAPGLATWLATWKGPQRVRMSERTSQLVPGMFQLQPLAGLGTPPEGKPLVAYEVAGERLITSRFKQAAVNELSPLVGREQELLRLVELWEEAKRGRGQFVLVSGDPGLGKSRVVHELIHRLGEETTHFVAQCWSQSRHSPFFPIIDLQYRALGLRKVDAPEAKLRRLEEVLSRHLGNPGEYVPLWASLMSVPLVPPYQDRALPPEQEKARTLSAISKLLMHLAEQRPVLVVLEDVHWVDHSTLELVNLLFRQVANARVLMVLTFRPEFRPPWPQAPHLHRISLDRLPAEIAARMVRESARLLQPELVSQMVSRADGIPLYLEQLARTVLEAGSPRALDIPDSLQDLLMARLDRLSSLAKDAAQLASVIGREFSWNMLRRLWPQDDAALHEALESLEDAGLLERKGSGEESRFTFRHTLIQETAHHSLLRKRRQQYHLQLARLLLEERKETAEAQPELVAHHFAEAGSVEQAVEFFERAGLRANQRSAHLDAVSHYSRALQLVQGLPESPARHRREVGLRIALGGPLMAVRGYAHPEVERVYRRARELCRFASEDAQLIPALMGLWQYYIVAGDLLASRELAEQLTALARAKGDETARVLAYRALSTTEHLQGEQPACLVHSLEGMALYQISKHRTVALKVGQDPGVAMAMYAGWAGWMMGRADDALRYAKEGTALGRELDHPMSLSLALCYLALVHNYRGEYAEALAAADEGLALSRNHGLSLWVAGCITQRGWARACLGSPEGLEEFADGIDAWTDTGAGIAVTFFSITLAELCLDAGRTADAASLLEDAAGLLGRNQEHFYEAELYRLEADLTLAADPTALDAAAAHLQRALEIAKRQGVLAFELRVRGDLLRLARQRGDDAEARRALEETLGRFDQGHDTVDLRRARALLANG